MEWKSFSMLKSFFEAFKDLINLNFRTSLQQLTGKKYTAAHD